MNTVSKVVFILVLIVVTGVSKTTVYAKSEGTARMEEKKEQKMMRKEEKDSEKIEKLASVSARMEEKEDKEEKKASRSAMLEEKHKEALERSAQARNIFKNKVKSLSDEQKKAILERLDGKYLKIQEKMVAQFTNILDRLEEILAKIETRGGSVADAQTAIDTARLAVEEFAAQTYVIEITDETLLREAAQQVHETLKSDIQEVRESIKSAHEALKQARKTIPEPTIAATPSATLAI